jgi:L-ascorbate metabolism protein UlaG (beta-lactamase superfamily)
VKQRSAIQSILIGLYCLLLSACGASNGVDFDPDKAHHGDGKFVSVKQGSFFGHFMMRMREDDPLPRDPEEIKSIVGVADQQLLATYATEPRVTWIGHATSLVQYRDISYLTDPHLTQYPFYYEVYVEPRYTQPALSFEQMPPIDFIVISHNHYDSLDHRSVDMFGDSLLWYVPLGLKAWFLDRGISSERVIELDWWESHRFNDQVEVTMTPAQAVDIHLKVKAQQSLPIHWGTFQLTIEPILEPGQLLVEEMNRRDIPLEQFRPAKIGDTLILD